MKKRAVRGEPQRFITEKVMSHESSECLLWPFNRQSSGYGLAEWNGRPQIVSRVVCELANGPASRPQLQAAHSCGNRLCCNKRHLSWKTRSENEADKVIHGTTNRGERCGAAKLSAGDVDEIRAQRGFATQEEIARRYGVSRALVSLILSGKRWAWREVRDAAIEARMRDNRMWGFSP